MFMCVSCTARKAKSSVSKINQYVVQQIRDIIGPEVMLPPSFFSSDQEDMEEAPERNEESMRHEEPAIGDELDTEDEHGAKEHAGAVEGAEIEGSGEPDSRVQLLRPLVRTYFSGNTMLMDRLLRYAVYHSRLSVVKYLVEREGARLEHQDIYGRTALFYATRNGDPSMLAFMQTGTNETLDLNHQDVAGETALHYAIEMSSFQSRDYVELLLVGGADPEIASNDGIMPIDIMDSDPGVYGEVSDMSTMLYCAFIRQLRPNPHWVCSVLNAYESGSHWCWCIEAKSLAYGAENPLRGSSMGDNVLDITWIHASSTDLSFLQKTLFKR